MAQVTSTDYLAEWDHSLFHRLQQALVSVISRPTTTTIRNLSTALDEARPWMLGLTLFPGPAPGDKAEVENNETTTPSGASVRISGQLLNAVENVANALNISQKLAATLVLQAEEQRPRYPSRSTVDIAIYVFFGWQGQMLDFIRELLRVSIDVESEIDQTTEILREWVELLLSERTTLGNGQEGYIVDLLFNQIDALQSRIDGMLGRVGDFEMLSFMVQALRSSQCKLVGILAAIAQSGRLGRGHIVKLLKWLQRAERPDGITTVMLSIFIASCRPLDTLESSEALFEAMDSLCRDRAFLSISANLVVQEQWKVPALKEVAKTVWTLFYLSAIRHDGAASHIGIDVTQADQLLADAIQGEMLPFLRNTLLSIRRERGLDPSDHAVQDGLWKLALATDPSDDLFVYLHYQNLITVLATKKHFLRNLRNREEDLSVRRSQATPPVMHYKEFLALLATLYTLLPPDSAETLWTDATFTSVVLDTRNNFPESTFWDMLTAIASGPNCATHCFEKLRDIPRIQWSSLFKFYQHYSDIMQHLFEPIKSNRSSSLDPMPHEDAELCKSWTRLLSTVIKGSKLAQSTLLQAKPYPIQQLFDLINCDIPLLVKAELMQAVAAFCSWGDNEVLLRAAEAYERISFADPTLEVRSSSKLPSPIGWIAKMEYVEHENQIYPLSRAHLSFLTYLLGARPRYNNLLRRSVQYIFDRILLVPNARRYASEKERWQLLSSVLAFIDKALLGFDMGDLLVINNRSFNSIASSLADDPGFLIMLRLLSEPEFLNNLSNIIDQAFLVPTISLSVLQQTLRIYARILDIQLVFSDVLLTSLANAGNIKIPIGLQSLEHYLLNHLSNINNIALFVGHDDPMISLTAVHIISALSRSPIFSRTDVFRGEYSTAVNRLAGILDASDDSIRIILGFCAKLDVEGADLSPEAIKFLQVSAMKGVATEDLTLVIRSAILDLLLEGGKEPEPNLSHFLLGFDFKARDFGSLNPESPSSQISALRIILEQLEDPLFFSQHPIIAAKSAELIYDLSDNPITGRSTMLFSAAVSQFPLRQLVSLPDGCPKAEEDVGVMSIGTQIIGPATGENVVAFMDYQRWILASSALSAYTFEGKNASVSDLALLLFEGVAEVERGPLLLDSLKCLDIQWRASPDASRNLEFYATFDFDSYKRPDVDWWDIEALKRAMKVYRSQLQKQGKIPAASQEAFTDEIEYITKRLATQNQETGIILAQGEFIVSWNATLKVALAMLFKHVPEDVQETILFDLLGGLLSRLSSENAPGILDVLCESILVTTTALVSVLLQVDGLNLPVQNIAIILQGVIDTIGRPGNTENARGNLYASITQLMRLVDVGQSVSDVISIASTSIPTPEIHRAVLSIIASRKDRFLSTLCKDALDDRDVWKTECFTLLGSIVAMCRTEKEREQVTPTIKNGFLTLFIKGIKDSEMALQDCLSSEPDNLHAYWVYEAKIAFLMAWAGSRRGAEELLDAGVFEILSMCSFMTVPPLVSQTMNGEESLASLSRQHGVFTCSLQLLSRILFNLSGFNRSGAGHAISFLNAHRETLLLLLREHQQIVTAAGIEEFRLIVSILAMVVHKIPSEDLRSSNGFGAFHLAVLSMGAHALDVDSWVDSLESDSDEANVQNSALKLSQIILGYLIATTAGLQSRSGSPVLTLGSQRSGNAKFISSAPSLSVVVDYLGRVVESLQDFSYTYESALERLEGGNESTLNSEPATTEDVLAAFKDQHALLSSVVDSLLLLIWRHLLFYANETVQSSDTVRPDNLSLSLGSFTASQKDNARSVVGTTRSLERVAALLRGTLDRLQEVELHPDLARDSSNAYHGMLSRRLAELTGILTQS